MDIKIGTSIVSWSIWVPSHPGQIPWQRCLDQVVEAGYEWIELGPYGYLPTDPAILRGELDKRKLKPCGMVVMRNLEEPSGWPALREDVLREGELLAGVGAKFLVLIDDLYNNLYTGQPIAPTKLDESAWQHLIESINKVAELVRDRFGLQLVFHPHADTHVEYEYQIEALLEQTDADLVSLCFDTGHHIYRGGDPLAFIRRWHHRIPYLHFKNMERGLLERVRAEHTPYVTALGIGGRCELSQGVVDFPALCQVLRDIEYLGWAIVEQGMYQAIVGQEIWPVPPDVPSPIAKRTRAYLRQIGMG